MRKTLYLSEVKESPRPECHYCAPYIFYDHSSYKWREDVWHFDDVDQVRREAKRQGYRID